MAKFSSIFSKSFAYFIFILVCMIGCLYHVTQITQVYLTFQTKIDVSFDAKSQIVVPMVSFCKSRFFLYEHDENFLKQINDLFPKSIHSKTHNISSVFLHCSAKTDKVGYNFFQKCNMETGGIQTGKTVNYHYVCYNFKHPKFSQSKPRQRGFIYEFWLYHHIRHRSEFQLYFTKDNNGPNGQSFNSLKLTGKIL